MRKKYREEIEELRSRILLLEGEVHNLSIMTKVNVIQEVESPPAPQVPYYYYITVPMNKLVQLLLNYFNLKYESGNIYERLEKKEVKKDGTKRTIAKNAKS